MMEIILSSESVRFNRQLINAIYETVLEDGSIDLFPSFITLIDDRRLLEDAITSPKSTSVDILSLLRGMGASSYLISEAYRYAEEEERIDVMQAITVS